MAAPRYDSSQMELIEQMRASYPTAREYETAKAFLDLKSAETSAGLAKGLV